MINTLNTWNYDSDNGGYNSSTTTGPTPTSSSKTFHNARDAKNLLNVLQNEIVPMYYNRNQDGLPREWITRIKKTIQSLN